MVKKICLLIVLISLGCSKGSLFEEFSHNGEKGEKEFLADSQRCEKEKNKHSNKIQGREFGFEGQDTGYLGCMKLEGWSKKTI